MLTIWTEKLDSPLDLLILLLRSFFTAEIRYNPEHLSNSCATILAALNKAGLARKFTPIELPLSGEGTLRPHEVHDGIDRLIAARFENAFLEESPNLRQALHSHLVRSLRHRYHYLTLAHAKIRNESANETNEFRLERTPFNAPLLDFLKENGYRASQSPSRLNSLKTFLAPLWEILRTTLTIGETVTGNISPGKPVVWVQYERSLLERSWSILFWRKLITTEGFDVVCYFDHSNDDITPETLKKIEQQGLRWLDCSRPHRLASLTLHDLVALIPIALSIDFKKPWWQHLFRLRYHTIRLHRSRLYSRFSVKLLMQHQESEWIPNAQADALWESNGIMLGTHWSNYPQYNLNTHSHPQHVFFVWGRVMREALIRKGNTFKHLLPSGLWVLPEKKPFQPLTLNENVSHTLAVFDSGTGLEAHHAPEQLSAFYKSIIGLLEKNPTWGVLNKGKYGISTKGKYGGGIKGLQDLPDGEEIVARLKPLVEEGRFLFIHRFVAPPTVSERADMTVCFSVNSPGFIAGIIGKRAVHWDCAGYAKHPFYSDPDQKILYHDLPAMEKAIQAAADGDTTIGDFSAWANLFDAFLDDQGAKRISAFIQDYMTTVAGGEPAKTALDKAVTAYKERNPIPTDFESDSKIWLRVS